MKHNPFIKELILHQKADFIESQLILPELLYRLITASVFNPIQLRIPSFINQSGLDGIVDSPVAFRQFVPQGKSFWEFSCSNDPLAKANENLSKRSEEFKDILAETTFIFVTPRSAAYTKWDINKQEAWIKKNKGLGWNEIRVIDATIIEHWLSLFPEIDLWLADKLGIPNSGFYSPAIYWRQLENYGKPNKLQPIVFIDGREKVKDKVIKVFKKELFELRIETLFPDEAIDFIIAVIESLQINEQYSFSGRCIILDNSDIWKNMCSLPDHYILIAKSNLDLDGAGADLRNFANTYGKSVIFSTTPSAYTHGNSINLPEMSPHQLSQNLIKCGYPEERARQIAEKCRGKITSLKRLLMDLSASPDWSRSDAASDLAIASLIGQWNANETGDIEAVTGILGKEYGEWIRVIRSTTLIPDPPLTQQNEKWHFISRFEGWQNLGKFLSNDDLVRFSSFAIKVLKEKDPKFDLPKDERWIADTRGKKKKYSEFLLRGLAETLALMGNYHEALLYTNVNKPEILLARTIKEIFKDSDWKNWATLNNHLPLIAEADPETFLEILETVIEEKQIIKDLFAQEGTAVTGWNYMTGILWSLESLAWSDKFLIRVCMILCELSILDSGGNWSNRPYNSLLNIFIPWIKQTAASIDKKIVALNNINNEFHELTWELLLDLLPKFGGRAVSPNYKPSWQNFIPEDFDERYSNSEYWQQVNSYVSMCLELVKEDFTKLISFLEHIDEIHEPYFSNIMEYLNSPEIINKSEEDKSKVWNLLDEKIRKHRKYHDAKWALPENYISKIESINNILRPENPLKKYSYLFNDYDIELYEDKGNFEEQRKLIENLRTNSIKEIYSVNGIKSVIEFTKTIKLPAEVGQALGRNKDIDEDNFLIPKYLDKKEKEIIDFIRGYVWTKYKINEFKWVNQFDFTHWNTEQKLQFLVILPFIPEIWEIAEKILGSDYEKYWINTDASPYYLKNENYHNTVDLLLKYKRPRAAIKIMNWMLHLKLAPDINKVYEVLLSNIQKEENNIPIDPHSIIQLIRWLQKLENVNEEILSRIEWIYLRWLDRFSSIHPKTLHKALATDPKFFCEVIRTVYRSSNEEKSIEPDDERSALAEQAYYLLQDWSLIPGTQVDGSINEMKLIEWVNNVKKMCSESGHISIALATIGKVFAHSEKDVSGFFINKKIGKILDKKEHKEMRDGFTTEKFNMRDAFFGSSGEEEKALSKEYEQYAEDSEKERFSRLATSLREIARIYKLDAEREAKSDPYDFY